MPSISRLFVPPLLVTVFVAAGQAQNVALNQAGMPETTETTSLLELPARLNVHDISRAEALLELRRGSGIRIAFSPSLLPDEQRVSCECRTVSVGDALERILRGTRLRFAEAGKHIVIQPDARSWARSQSFASTTRDRPSPTVRTPRVALVSAAIADAGRPGRRQGTVTGSVTNADTGEPIPSALVEISGTTLQDLTNTEGRFLIVNVPAGEVEVRVQVLGYAAVSQTVILESGGTVALDFELAQVALALDDLVVVGYTTQARRTIAGAVTSVQAADIEARQVVTLQDALKGRVPGVNVRNSGRPGEPAVVDVRGRAFTADNAPLYVVDGMYLSDLRNLNPSDIESIQVLKDASAASQYGARAANGVVVVTTKQGGGMGGNRVTLRSSFGYQQIPRLIPMMNAQEWAQLTIDKYENARQIDPTSPTVPAGVFDVLEGRNTIDTDWQREITRPGHLHDQVLSVAGGTPAGDATYFVSGGYTNNKGTILDTDFRRYTLRVNSQLRRGRVTIGESLMLSRSDRTNPTTPEQGQLGEALRMFPSIPVFNTDGSFGPNTEYGIGTANYPTFASNPVGGSLLSSNMEQRNEIFGTLFAQVDLLPELSYRLQAGLRYNDDKGDIFNRTGMVRQNTGPFPTSLEIVSDLTTTLLLEHLLSLNRSVGIHTINATVGTSQQRNERNFISASRTSFDNEDLRVLPAGTQEINNNQVKAESRLNSFLGRASYSLLDRYIAEATFRRDGSSRFGPLNRWGNFWSGALGWVVSDEAFFRNVPLLGGADFFKLRASYGTQGNQDFADYEWQTTVVSVDPAGGDKTCCDYILGGETGTFAPGLIAVSLGNPAIRWQDNTIQNYGIDLALFGNRLAITAEYYRTESDGVLARVPLIPSIGSRQAPFVNAGAIQNTGLELAVQHTYSRPSFELSSGANLTTIRNKVLRLGGQDEDIIQGASRTAVGEPLGHFWLYRTCGVFQTQADVDAHGAQPNARPGDLCFVDQNGDGQITDEDRAYAGSPWPKLEGGLFFDGRLRAFDFFVGLRGSFGQKAYNAIRPALEDMTGDNNAPTWLQPWTEENPSTTTPRAYWGGVGADNARGPNDRYLENNSYFKLQNIQVGYSFQNGSTDPMAPGIAGFLSRAGLDIQSARVFVNVQDIHTFTSYLGYDPEFRGGTLTPGEDGGGVGGRYPNPRTFTFGIELGL